MTKREIIHAVLDFQRPPYLPWSFRFTEEARGKLVEHFGSENLDELVQNHILGLGNDIGFFTEAGDNLLEDVFGVVWDRSVDRDIGIPRNTVIGAPTLRGLDFPDPLDPRFFEDIPDKLARYGDRFRLYCIGFSLFERAWTLRGMENLLMDFIEHPRFVHELLEAITDYNIAQVRAALTYDIDAIEFGDDWGQQRGLLMGYPLWKEFIYPQLKRLYGVVREAGKYVFIHSCGDVNELFDDLIDIGLNCFNPFQPDVMDVDSILKQYRGRLAFWGGLSTQHTLPFGTVREVRSTTRHLIEVGRAGSFILAPSHDVTPDVPLENMLAFIEEVLAQPQLAET
ncbi:hypothetical protein ES708_07176 [subsurface metagenome]